MDEKWAILHTSCRVSCYNCWWTLHCSAVQSRFSSPSAFSCGYFGFGLIIPKSVLTLCSLEEMKSLRGVTLVPSLAAAPLCSFPVEQAEKPFNT